MTFKIIEWFKKKFTTKLITPAPNTWPKPKKHILKWNNEMKRKEDKMVLFTNQICKIERLPSPYNVGMKFSFDENPIIFPKQRDGWYDFEGSYKQ